jgi:hypothetical protein
VVLVLLVAMAGYVLLPRHTPSSMGHAMSVMFGV